uniref:PX domain-containing protein n=1 Tax=Hyaloperonospora arabidopsidis (strain Emoy2) TaxID=559515 RepID=M4BP36_HYAAE
MSEANTTPTALEKTVKRCSSIFQLRSLRPVSAKIISYGRETSSRRCPTLYVLRVTRSGTGDWYVAKRYSEFRALHETLGRHFNGGHNSNRGHSSCGACEELETFYSNVRFPDRHIFESGLRFSKKRLDATRIKELDSYMRFLLETTQGLLGDEESGDGDDEGETLDCDDMEDGRCPVLDLIREFLMVNEDHVTEANVRTSEDEEMYSNGRQSSTEVGAAAPKRQMHRLSRRSSSVTSFHVRELDLVSISPATDESMRSLFAEDWWDPMFADVFDEAIAPPENAFIFRQIEDASRPLRLIESYLRR